MRLVAEIIGWIVLGGCGLSVLILVGMIMWSAIDDDLFYYKQRREEKRRRNQPPKIEPTEDDYLNGDADILTGRWF